MQYRVIKRFVYMGRTYLPDEVWLPQGAHTDKAIQNGRWVQPMAEEPQPAPTKPQKAGKAQA